MSGTRIFDDDFENNPCCAAPEIIVNEESMRVCSNCGIVIGLSYVSTEKRAYTAAEINTRRRTEPRWRTFGPRTVIGLNAPDGKGQSLASQQKALFNRLSRIQGSLINSLERNYWEARPKIALLSKKLHIPTHIVETAWTIYTEVAKQKLTMGRSIESFVTASLYAAIRIHSFPRLLEEIVEMSFLPMRSVHRSLGMIVRHVLPVLKLSYRPVTAGPLVYRFGNDLGLSVRIQKKAADLLNRSSKRGLQKIGKDPKGLAAAALYLASRPSTERRTQTEIATVAHITEVTLRTRAKQIRTHL